MWLPAFSISRLEDSYNLSAAFLNELTWAWAWNAANMMTKIWGNYMRSCMSCCKWGTPLAPDPSWYHAGGSSLSAAQSIMQAYSTCAQKCLSIPISLLWCVFICTCMSQGQKVQIFSRRAWIWLYTFANFSLPKPCLCNRIPFLLISHKIKTVECQDF